MTLQVSKKKAKRFYVFLFSDILLLTKQKRSFIRKGNNDLTKYEFLESFPLLLCKAVPHDVGEEFSMCLTLGQGKEMILTASSDVETKEWIQVLQECITTSKTEVANSTSRRRRLTFDATVEEKPTVVVEKEDVGSGRGKRRGNTTSLPCPLMKEKTISIQEEHKKRERVMSHPHIFVFEPPH